MATWASAQDTTVVDTSQQVDYEHIPKRAVLWSLFPGAGQFYNEVGYWKVQQKRGRAWWKIPIVWGGLGACGYYWWHNYSNAKLIKEEVLHRREFGDTTNLHPSLLHYEDENDLINGYALSPSQQYLGFDTYAKRRDIFLFATVGVYALTMIEAFVDAHFVTFDVSDDLSIRTMPIMYDSRSMGLSLQFNFM